MNSFYGYGSTSASHWFIGMGEGGCWIERELISQRTKEVLARRKSEGKQLGRPKQSFGVSKLDQHEDEIRKLLSHGVSKAAIARMYGSSWQTVQSWARRSFDSST
jgi:DNA invertase Pin-like site-specific DNA recombinase